MKRSKDVIYLFCCQGHLKNLQKAIYFVENLEMTHAEGDGRGGRVMLFA